MIRFFAAFLVVLAHGFHAHFAYFQDVDTASPFFLQFVMNGAVGVDIFFLISGFLITYLLLVEKEQFRKINIWKFLARRMLRIWPLYFLLIILTPILVYWLDTAPPNYWSNLFFYGNFQLISDGAWSYPFAHFWSIAIEEQFYLIWPFIVAFTPRKVLLPLFLLLIGLSMGSRAWVFYEAPNSWHIYLNTLCRMDILVLGGVFAYFFHTKKWKFRLPSIFWIAGLVLFIIAMGMEDSKKWYSLWESIFKKYLFILPVLPVLFHFCINSNSSKKERPRWIRPLDYLGKASYGLYLIHNFLIVIVITKIMMNNGLKSGLLFWGIYLVMTIILVVISFEWYEKPFLRLKRFFTVVKNRDF